MLFPNDPIHPTQLPMRMQSNRTHKNRQRHKIAHTHDQTPGNLDFENLSHSLYDVWSDHGRATNNYLNRAQLELVCEQVGLHGRIASKVADEVFEKLGLDGDSADADGNASADDRVCFADFIALIQSDSETTVTLSANASGQSTSFVGAGSGSALLLSELSTASATAAVRLLTAVSPPAEDFVIGGLDGMPSRLNASKDSNDSPLLLAGHSTGLLCILCVSAVFIGFGLCGAVFLFCVFWVALSVCVSSSFGFVLYAY